METKIDSYMRETKIYHPEKIYIFGNLEDTQKILENLKPSSMVEGNRILFHSSNTIYLATIQDLPLVYEQKNVTKNSIIFVYSSQTDKEKVSEILDSMKSSYASSLDIKNLKQGDFEREISDLLVRNDFFEDLDSDFSNIFSEL